MARKDRLVEYRSKRDLSRSGEQSGAVNGHKLTGGYALTRAKLGGGDREKWLLVKQDDEGADRRAKPAKTRPESVLTGRVNDDLVAT